MPYHPKWRGLNVNWRHRMVVNNVTYATITSFANKLQMLEMPPAGLGSIEQVAQRLALSKRSLQRHLGDEAVSFQEVLNQVRRELAQHYLVNSTISPGEISWLLGFQETNSFVRAFRSWTGQTPGAYRMGQQRSARHYH